MDKPRIANDTPALPRWWLRPAWARYVAGLTPVAVAAVLEWLLDVNDATHFLLLFIGILVGSVFGGFGPGLLATAVATVFGRYWLMSSAGEPSTWPHSVHVLCGQGILLSVVGGLLRQAYLKAEAAWGANRELERQILEIGDSERSRMGHDLHDGLGQHLAGISMLSESLAQRMASGAPAVAADMELITRLAAEAVGRTRDLARSLSPVTLEQEGLVVALEELAQNVSKLFNIACECSCDYDCASLGSTRAQHLFRIAQEAASNSAKHGKARHVWIGLHQGGPSDKSSLVLTVRDDGVGLSDKTTRNPGLGLRIMEYRARMVGARLTIERAEETGGTLVTCRCSVSSNGRADQDTPHEAWEQS